MLGGSKAVIIFQAIEINATDLSNMAMPTAGCFVGPQARVPPGIQLECERAIEVTPDMTLHQARDAYYQ